MPPKQSQTTDAIFQSDRAMCHNAGNPADVQRRPPPETADLRCPIEGAALPAMTFANKPARGFSLTLIGHVRTPWSKGNCPKNMAAAREANRPATLMIDPPWREGLQGLERASHLILLGWFGDADRNLLMLKPPHAAAAQGCFSLRSPARPNPIGVSIVRRTSLGLAAGLVTVDALDWYDGTALLDIKPYYPSTDSHPDALVVDP